MPTGVAGTVPEPTGLVQSRDRRTVRSTYRLWEVSIVVAQNTTGSQPPPPGGFGTGTAEFIEGYVTEDPVLAAARAHAAELGVQVSTPGCGATLRLIAAVGNARSVVEVGTGTGVSGVWLLRGMRPDGVLTTIDLEAEYQRVARRIFAGAGFAPSRTRIIAGRALDVLPRLADRVYDLVFVDHDTAEYPAGVAAAERLLRPGGVLVLGRALAGGRLGDPAARDPETVTVREVVKALRDSDEWIPALLPIGTGLLAAARRG